MTDKPIKPVRRTTGAEVSWSITQEQLDQEIEQEERLLDRKVQRPTLEEVNRAMEELKERSVGEPTLTNKERQTRDCVVLVETGLGDDERGYEPKQFIGQFKTVQAATGFANQYTRIVTGLPDEGLAYHEEHTPRTRRLGIWSFEWYSQRLPDIAKRFEVWPMIFADENEAERWAELNTDRTT